MGKGGAEIICLISIRAKKDFALVLDGLYLQDDLSFTKFKSLWKELKMSHIHQSTALDSHTYPSYLQFLFDALFSMLFAVPCAPAANAHTLSRQSKLDKLPSQVASILWNIGKLSTKNLKRLFIPCDSLLRRCHICLVYSPSDASVVRCGTEVVG